MEKKIHKLLYCASIWVRAVNIEKKKSRLPLFKLKLVGTNRSPVVFSCPEGQLVQLPNCSSGSQMWLFPHCSQSFTINFLKTANATLRETFLESLDCYVYLHNQNISNVSIEISNCFVVRSFSLEQDVSFLTFFGAYSSAGACLKSFVRLARIKSAVFSNISSSS